MTHGDYPNEAKMTVIFFFKKVPVIVDVLVPVNVIVDVDVEVIKTFRTRGRGRNPFPSFLKLEEAILEGSDLNIAWLVVCAGIVVVNSVTDG